MAAGSGLVDGGEGEAWGHADAEGQLLDAELNEAECMLVGEVQQIESLAQENKNKVEELRGLKEDMKTLQERNEYHVSMLQDEHTSVRQELAHRLTVLREQAIQLGLKNERYKVVTRLNETAAAQVESLLRKMERRTKTHGEEVHAIRQEVLHLRQQLESTFRKTLKDLGGTYRREAFEALAVEAKAGWRANKCLREEMALQEVGVQALGERHKEQTRRQVTFAGELGQLRRLKANQKTTLAVLRRETRANTDYFADIQETRGRLAAAENKLKRDLEKQGVPNCSLSDIREMTVMKKEECRRLNKFKLRWRRRTQDVMRAINPSIPDPGPDTPSLLSASSTISTPTSRSTLSNFGSACVTKSSTRFLAVGEGAHQSRRLRESKSAPPAVEASMSLEATSPAAQSPEKAVAILPTQTDAEAGWQARVRRVIQRWSRADGGSSSETGCGQGPYRHDPNISTLTREPFKGDATGQGRMVQFQWKKSPSTSAMESGLSQSFPKQLGTIKHPSGHPLEPNSTNKMVPPNPRHEVPKAGQAVILSGSASMGHLAFRGVIDEDPWEKKRRMERAVRCRDAGLRARGLAVNNSRSKSPHSGRRRDKGRLDTIDVSARVS